MIFLNILLMDLMIENHSIFIYSVVLPPQLLDYCLLIDSLEILDPFISLWLHSFEFSFSWTFARMLMSQHCSFEEE